MKCECGGTRGFVQIGVCYVAGVGPASSYRHICGKILVVPKVPRPLRVGSRMS